RQTQSRNSATGDDVGSRACQQTDTRPASFVRFQVNIAANKAGTAKQVAGDRAVAEADDVSFVAQSHTFSFRLRREVVALYEARQLFAVPVVDGYRLASLRNGAIPTSGERRLSEILHATRHSYTRGTI